MSFDCVTFPTLNTAPGHHVLRLTGFNIRSSPRVLRSSGPEVNRVQHTQCDDSTRTETRQWSSLTCSPGRRGRQAVGPWRSGCQVLKAHLAGDTWGKRQRAELLKHIVSAVSEKDGTHPMGAECRYLPFGIGIDPTACEPECRVPCPCTPGQCVRAGVWVGVTAQCEQV